MCGRFGVSSPASHEEEITARKIKRSLLITTPCNQGGHGSAYVNLQQRCLTNVIRVLLYYGHDAYIDVAVFV